MMCGTGGVMIAHSLGALVDDLVEGGVDIVRELDLRDGRLAHGRIA